MKSAGHSQPFSSAASSGDRSFFSPLAQWGGRSRSSRAGRLSEGWCGVFGLGVNTGVCVVCREKEGTWIVGQEKGLVGAGSAGKGVAEALGVREFASSVAVGGLVCCLLGRLTEGLDSKRGARVETENRRVCPGGVIQLVVFVTSKRSLKTTMAVRLPSSGNVVIGRLPVAGSKGGKGKGKGQSQGQGGQGADRSQPRTHRHAGWC